MTIPALSCQEFFAMYRLGFSYRNYTRRTRSPQDDNARIPSPPTPPSLPHTLILPKTHPPQIRSNCQSQFGRTHTTGLVSPPLLYDDNLLPSRRPRQHCPNPDPTPIIYLPRFFRRAPVGRPWVRIPREIGIYMILMIIQRSRQLTDISTTDRCCAHESIPRVHIITSEMMQLP